MADNIRHQLLCPICCKATEDIRDTTIPYEARERAGGPKIKFALRLVLCATCAPLVEKTIAASHAKTRVPFHPRMLQCLWAALINQERDPVEWAAAEFASIYDEHNPQN